MTIFAVALAIIAALHISFLDEPVARSVGFIEREYIDRSRFDSEQLKALEVAVRKAKGAEKYLENIHRRLLNISITGFGILAILSGIATYLANRASREVHEK